MKVDINSSIFFFFLKTGFKAITYHVKFKLNYYLTSFPAENCYYVHPLGGRHIIFAFSAVRRPTWFPDILGNSSYPIFTKFGMQVYWVNSLYGIAFGDDSSIAN